MKEEVEEEVDANDDDDDENANGNNGLVGGLLFVEGVCVSVDDDGVANMFKMSSASDDPLEGLFLDDDWSAGGFVSNDDVGEDDESGRVGEESRRIEGKEEEEEDAEVEEEEEEDDDDDRSSTSLKT